MISGQPQRQEEDFRRRVAREKRERMRSRLLQAAHQLFLHASPTKPPVIDDVIREAEVSRGTFYKYFDSLDAVLEVLGEQVANETIATYQSVFAELGDAAARVVAGPLLSLTHAGMQPLDVALTSRVNFVAALSPGDRIWDVVTGCLTEAKSAGVLDYQSIEAATDFIIGATLEGSRRMMLGAHFDQAYCYELIQLMMRGVGMEANCAEQAIRLAWQTLESKAEQIGWWQPPAGAVAQSHQRK